jgi:hypothetical protein
MSKKSAALEAKFGIAVKTLMKAPMLTVPEAMLVAKFSTKDIANKSMQRNVARRIPGGKRAMAASLPPASLPPSIVDVITCESPQISNLSTLTGCDGGTAIAGRIQPPKRKQQRMTASSLQQKRVEDLKQKRHLAARAMSQEEFDQLVADRYSLIVDSMCVSMPTSANELIVGSISCKFRRTG